ncbi:MAG TPA: hypothetical protein VJ997_13345, partial [Longimicrobiales bacterium]|nr:hypothetical protein [Longimicrobiales bacterium]
MKRLPLGVALWAWAGGVQAQTPDRAPAEPRYITAGEAIAWAPRPYDARISYGADSLQYGELRLPAGSGPFPVAVVIHGGCWLSIANNDYMDRVAERLTQDGW